MTILRRKMIGAVALAAGMLPAAAAASIDDEIAARINVINQVLERLAFDASRIDSPPAYQQAATAIDSRFGAAASVQTDVDFTALQVDVALVGEAEASGPTPVDVGITGTFAEPSADYGVKGSVAGGLNLSVGAFHRLCVDPLPWAIYALYRGIEQLPGQDPFPEIVPGEVYVDDTLDGDPPLDPSTRQPTAIDKVADFDDNDPGGGLSADALAFLGEVANQVFDGLDEVQAGGQDGLGFIATQINDVTGELGVSASTIAHGATHLAGAFNLDGLAPSDPAQIPSTIGGIFSIVADAPGQLAELIPFAPDVSWLGTNPLGIDSVGDLDVCSSMDLYDTTGGDPLPYVSGVIDEYCGVVGTIAGSAGEVVGAINTFVTDDLPAAAQTIFVRVGMVEDFEWIAIYNADYYQGVYEDVLHYVGKNMWDIGQLLKDFGNQIRNTLEWTTLW